MCICTEATNSRDASTPSKIAEHPSVTCFNPKAAPRSCQRPVRAGGRAPTGFHALLATSAPGCLSAPCLTCCDSEGCCKPQSLGEGAAASPGCTGTRGERERGSKFISGAGSLFFWGWFQADLYLLSLGTVSEEGERPPMVPVWVQKLGTGFCGLPKPWFVWARNNPQQGILCCPLSWSHRGRSRSSLGVLGPLSPAALLQVCITYETAPCRVLGMVIR